MSNISDLKKSGVFERLAGYCRLVFEDQPPAKHHRLLCRKLEEVEKGTIKRLMVFMPPGSAKSHYANVLFSAWFVGRNPTKSIITCSATSTLAARWGRRVRNLVSHPYTRAAFGVSLASDSKAMDRWETSQGGEYYAAGVGATIVGRRADLVVIDDPVADRQAADSPLARERLWDWYKSDLWTRVKPDGAIVLIMTRWHEDDLAGRLVSDMEMGGEQWEVIKIPAIAESVNDVLGRKLGEHLWPEWFTSKMFEQAQRDKRTWNALYQQRPSSEEGNIFKSAWFRLWPRDKRLPNIEYVVQSWDTAYTEKTENDPTACSTFGIFWDDGRWCALLFDCWTDHLEYPELRKKALKEYSTEYGEPGRRPDVVLIEEKGSGITLCQDLLRAGVPVRRYNPGRADKVQRAHSVAHLLEAGLVYLPESSRTGKWVDWADDWVREICAFPRAAHDDQVDTLTQALAVLRDQQWLSIDPDSERFYKKPPSNPYTN